MSKTGWIAVCAIACLAVLGCSGADTKSIPATSGSTDSGAAIVSADADVSGDPEIASSVTLTMDPFTVNPGEEVYKCQDFANPFQGQQVDIKTYELHMAKGSHHMFAFYEPNAANTSVITCPQGGLQFQPFTFASQIPDNIQTYPEGIGATIPTTSGFTLNAHYINPGSTPITGHVALTLYVAKPGIVTQHAGVLFLNQALLVVPATGQPYTSTSTYTLPQDVHVLTSVSHMHQRATNFMATFAGPAATGGAATGDAATGETLFSTTTWAEPTPEAYTPPLLLTAGTSITWSCTYLNNTGQPLTFGESAATNVMCISVSTIYPVPDITNPVISTQF